MATTNQLVTRAKQILSRVNDSTLDAFIITELGAAQEALEQEAWLPDFLYASEIVTITTEYFDLEAELTRYLRLHDRAGGIQYFAGATATEPYVKLKRYDEKEILLQDHPGPLATGSHVLGYFGVDTLVSLRPYPSAGAPQDLQIHYFQAEADLPAAGNSNLWTLKASEYLLGRAGLIPAQRLRDDKALSIFQGLEARGKARLQKKMQADEQADQEYIMGGRD